MKPISAWLTERSLPFVTLPRAQSLCDDPLTKRMLVTLVLSCLSVSAFATPYYVSPNGSDTNDGSAGHPWATIQRAAASVHPGDTVHVAPGNYLGPVVSSVSGTVNSRILFVSDTKWKAKITFSSSGSISGWRNNGDYVDIQDFDVTGSGGDGTAGINQEGSFSRVIGCHVHNIVVSGVASNGGAGIDDSNYSAHDDDIIGNVVHDISATGPDTGTAPEGIYHANPRGHVWNNISYSNSGWGIQLWHFANGATVANNLVFGNKHGGIVVGSETVAADYNLILNNIVIYNGGAANYGWGIVEESLTGPHNRYSYNLVYGNVFSKQIAVNVGDVGTLKIDPLFVNFQADGSGNYHLKPNSPCIGAGIFQGAPPDDLDGGARPQGANVDIGPYQKLPAPSGLKSQSVR